jgi:hypothetical protein
VGSAAEAEHGVRTERRATLNGISIPVIMSFQCLRSHARIEPTVHRGVNRILRRYQLIRPSMSGASGVREDSMSNLGNTDQDIFDYTLAETKNGRDQVPAVFLQSRYLLY